MLDIDALRNTPDAIVRLTLMEQGKVFSSFITENLSISGSAQFTDPFSDAFMDKMSGFNKTMDALTASSGALTGGNGINAAAFRQQKTLGQTMSQYQSSDRPVFNIPMVFITTRAGQRLDLKAVELASLVYPELQSEQAEDKQTAAGNASGQPQGTSVSSSGKNRLAEQFIPPCNYRWTDSGYPAGTWMLEIGRWFRATDLVLTSATLEMSKQRVAQTGEALFSLVNCQLQPAYATTASQFMRYFRIPSIRLTSSSTATTDTSDKNSVNSGIR